LYDNRGMSATTVDGEGAPIAAVEQATGIARATLRIWERRYGFPQPGRDLRGERSYPEEQVRKLRLIADLMARGHRPGRLVALTDKQLSALAGPGARDGTARRVPTRVEEPVLGPLADHDTAGLAQLLEASIRDLGLQGFVAERMPQINVNVGLAWQRGEIEVYEEHLYTEVVQQVVRGHLARLQPHPAPPRVLLATFPEESHTLGLLMAQVLLALEGCRCTSLGGRVPVAQLVTAARAFRADIVGVSCTASMNPSHVLRGLEQLRGELGPQVAIWAGGSSPVLARQRVAGVQVMPHIREVLPALAHWRARNLAPA
jgi:MerR family transcriptional regulator, light-induced transcriptional regulator